MSYYAVTNSIDGQPLIDKLNLIRFYPVFALRDSVEFVKVTVYYGNELSIEDAVRKKNGLFWESKLPEFGLGDAIQRYEVEVGIKYDINIERSIREYREEVASRKKVVFERLGELESTINSGLLREIDELTNSLKLEELIKIRESQELSTLEEKVNSFAEFRRTEIIPKLTEGRANLDSLEMEFLDLQAEFPNFIIVDTTRLSNINDSLAFPISNISKDSIRFLDPTTINETTNLENIQTAFINMEGFKEWYQKMAAIKAAQLQKIESLEMELGNLLSEFGEPITEDLKTLISNLKELKLTPEENQELDNVNKLNAMFSTILTNVVQNTDLTDENELSSYIVRNQKLLDSLKGNLISQLSDKEFSGSGIQKSDIIYYDNFKKAKILYRNYRRANRTLVALDPAEKLSIFRLRYVPFPVIDNALEGPTSSDVPVVFEAGITFGNQVITSNEFLTPEFSIKRLGVAVAFTSQFFAEDADVRALLFTYDFNAYASIGLGANFGVLNGSESAKPYYSFGINQRAFQALVQGIGNIFKNIE